jgi:hypothetical protein
VEKPIPWKGERLRKCGGFTRRVGALTRRVSHLSRAFSRHLSAPRVLASRGLRANSFLFKGHYGFSLAQWAHEVQPPQDESNGLDVTESFCMAARSWFTIPERDRIVIIGHAGSKPSV